VANISAFNRSRFCLKIGEGFLLIPHPKEKKPKFVPLLKEDIELVRKLPRGFPEMPFFRHLRGVSGCRAGRAFGDKYLYKWWKKACENLGIEGVELYGGTRHNSAIALRKLRTPEEIKRATMHSTNKMEEPGSRGMESFSAYKNLTFPADTPVIHRFGPQFGR
jgi:hypothetical protein